TRRGRRSRTRSSRPSWLAAASTSTTALARRCAPTCGASTSCTPTSCGASACSRNSFPVLEQPGEVHTHEARSRGKARSDGDLNSSGGKVERRRLDAEPGAVFFAHKTLGKVLHGQFPLGGK